MIWINNGKVIYHNNNNNTLKGEKSTRHEFIMWIIDWMLIKWWWWKGMMRYDLIWVRGSELLITVDFFHYFVMIEIQIYSLSFWEKFHFAFSFISRIFRINNWQKNWSTDRTRDTISVKNYNNPSVLLLVVFHHEFRN